MLTRQLQRYVLVGLVNTAVGYGSIMLLRYALGWHDLAANLGGFAVGMVVSYALNRTFTFASERRHLHAIPLFIGSVAACYSLNAVVLMALLDRTSLPSFAAQAFAMLAYNVSFFVLSRSVVFNR